MMLGWGGYDGRIKIYGADLKRQIPSLDLYDEYDDDMEDHLHPAEGTGHSDGRVSPDYGSSRY